MPTIIVFFLVNHLIAFASNCERLVLAIKQEDETYKMVHAAQFSIDFQSNVGQVLILLCFDACLGKLHMDRMQSHLHIANSLWGTCVMSILKGAVENDRHTLIPG